MSENNAQDDEGLFDIDMDNIDLTDDYFKNVEKIQIFVLSSTLPNPYLLVMFGVLKLFLEKIKNKYPDLKSEIYINFLLIHELGKYEEIVSFFSPLKAHYEYFIQHKEGEALKRDISSIIEMRFNEFKTLANMIMLNIVDGNAERLITKDTLMNFRYADIYARSDKIREDSYEDEVNEFMESYEKDKLEKPEEVLDGLFFKKVGEKEELVKCLLNIFCYELPQNSEKSIFFIVDWWLKNLIEKYSKLQSSSSARFKEIHKRLICPREDPVLTKFDFYLNPISKYKVTGTEINPNYFSSLLQKLSCNLFKEPFKGFYEETPNAYKRYRTYLKDPTTFKDLGKENFPERFQKPIIATITNGFITVQEDTLTQLVYIA